MHLLLSFCFFILLQPSFISPSVEDGLGDQAQQVSENSLHDQWDNLLRRYVDPEGNVNYKGFQSSADSLDKYLFLLAENPPGQGEPRAETLAYYINLYNAATVKLILDHYPVQSIRDIKKPWDRQWVKVGEKSLSLGEIEHKILRKMGDPRIHFAINCASYSCPKLGNRAYMAEKLESQLESASRDFINDPKRNRISRDQAEISQIFKWYKSDFTEKSGLKEYINKYSDQAIGSDTKLEYIKYDWSLNEAQ